MGWLVLVEYPGKHVGARAMRSDGPLAKTIRRLDADINLAGTPHPACRGNPVDLSAGIFRIRVSKNYWGVLFPAFAGLHSGLDSNLQELRS